MTKHFFKALVTFSALIIIGLIGVFLVSYLDAKESVSGGKGLDAFAN